MMDRVRDLRANSTAPERRMWRLLHPFRTSGYHFRKQAPIGPFVADFACHHARLVIEVDGDTHFMEVAQRRDARRDAFLRAEGYMVLRFTNDEVMHNPDGVYDVVMRALAGRPARVRGAHPLPNPPHKGEGAGAVGLSAIVPHAPVGTSPLVGEVGRGAYLHGAEVSGVLPAATSAVAHPLPNPPHKGEGAGAAVPSSIAPNSPACTSPLVGEVGRGDSDV